MSSNPSSDPEADRLRRGVRIPLGVVLIGLGAASWPLAYYLQLPWLYACGPLLAFTGGFVLPSRLWRARPPAAPVARCGTCISFDLKAGQRVIESAAHFPSNFLSPDQMAWSKRRETALVAGQTPEELEEMADGAPRGVVDAVTEAKLEGRLHSWDQYGVCAKEQALVNRYDVQDCWRQRPVEDDA